MRGSEPGAQTDGGRGDHRRPADQRRDGLECVHSSAVWLVGHVAGHGTVRLPCAGFGDRDGEMRTSCRCGQVQFGAAFAFVRRLESSLISAFHDWRTFIESSSGTLLYVNGQLAGTAAINEGEDEMNTAAAKVVPAAAEDADRQLKAKHRALWASGDYPAVAAELIPELGPELVRACGVQPGHRVLDVAAGSGNAAIPAAQAGGVVTASDLTPELFDAGRRIAAEHRVDLEWVEADAEALPFADNSFDIVMSSVGAMFAPHHQVTADELVRVCRPGGTIGMINWTPQGFIGQLFATMKLYAPPPPPGASPAPLWGDETHVRKLFGDKVTGPQMRRQSIVMDHCANPLEFREYWKRNYGPTIAVYRFNEDHPERVEQLDSDFLSFLAAWSRSTEGGRTACDAEYLMFTATKR